MSRSYLINYLQIFICTLIYSSQSQAYELYPDYLANVSVSIPDNEYISLGTSQADNTLSATISGNGNTASAYTELNDIGVLASSSNAYAEASADFNQTFYVIGAGSATLTFSWDGYVEAKGSSASYSYSANVDYYGPSYFSDSIYDYNDYYDVNGTIDKTYSTTVNFTEDDIGEFFTVSVSLSAQAGDNFYWYYDDWYYDDWYYDEYLGEEIENTIDAPDSYALVDFYNTGTFTYDGQGVVIAPAAVPIPASLGLLGTALLALVGLRRKQHY